MKQLWVGGPRQAIWHKQVGEEKQADPCHRQAQGESVDGQQGGIRDGEESGQQGEHVSGEQPHLSGLHQEGTERAEDDLTCGWRNRKIKLLILVYGVLVFFK